MTGYMSGDLVISSLWITEWSWMKKVKTYRLLCRHACKEITGSVESIDSVDLRRLRNTSRGMDWEVSRVVMSDKMVS